MKIRPLLTLILLSLPLTTSVAQPKDIDTYVEKVMKTFDVPGISLSIVKDGKVILTKGYGLRTIGTNDRVDDHTLFGIASNTKAFTATAIALLVEEGKLKWDAPVINYLPAFRLSDPYVTRELTIRDLLVHRSGLGLGAGDLLWWPASDYNRKQIVRQLRYIPLATSFRSAYAYDNVLYLVAGEVIEAVSGQTWEDFVATRILAKLGMTSTNVRHSDAGMGGNVATPHAPVNGKVRPVKPFTSDNTNPAGGINTNAVDIAKWMICQLDSGRAADGSRLFSPASTRQLWGMVTPIPIGDPPPEVPWLKTNFNGYALGFGIRDYLGRKMVSHTGGLPGYVSRIMMIPALRLGVAVFTNQESGEAFDAVAYHVVDHYLEAPSFDWLGALHRLRTRIDSITTVLDANATAARAVDSRPSLPLERYAGTYTDAWYGDLVITLSGGKLSIRMARTPDLSGTLEHFQHDTFVARWTDPEMRADAYVTFSLNPDGSIDRVKMQAVSRSTDFSFDFQDLLFKPSGAAGK